MLLVAACVDDERVVGEQCPSPYARGASRMHDAGPNAVYGTSCAPCDPEDVRVDARGCPVYVTVESCGGDVCIGRVRLRQADEDAGADDDAGADEEDAGDGP